LMPRLPAPLIATVAEILANHYSHTDLNTLFTRCRAPGLPSGGNKVQKVTGWLHAADDDSETDAFRVLGCVLKNFMERNTNQQDWLNYRIQIMEALAEFGFAYGTGGNIRGGATGVPSRSLETIIRQRDLTTVETEFNRALASVESDPGQAVTAACAIVESLCKVYIEDNGLEFPREQTLKPLWKVVRGHFSQSFSAQPGSLEAQDMIVILGGLTSALNGIGDLRTHAGSAHGRGRESYELKPTDARLAVHAAHTVVAFVLEKFSG